MLRDTDILMLLAKHTHVCMHTMPPARIGLPSCLPLGNHRLLEQAEYPVQPSLSREGQGPGKEVNEQSRFLIPVHHMANQ